MSSLSTDGLRSEWEKISQESMKSNNRLKISGRRSGGRKENFKTENNKMNYITSKIHSKAMMLGISLEFQIKKSFHFIRSYLHIDCIHSQFQSFVWHSWAQLLCQLWLRILCRILVQMAGFSGQIIRCYISWDSWLQYEKQFKLF